MFSLEKALTVLFTLEQNVLNLAIEIKSIRFKFWDKKFSHMLRINPLELFLLYLMHLILDTFI